MVYTRFEATNLVGMSDDLAPRSMIALIKSVGSRHRVRSTAMVCLLFLSSFSEGVGLLSLMPLLEILSDSSGGASSQATSLIEGLFSLVGMEPTLGSLLCLIAVGMTLKSLLLFITLRQAGAAAADTTAELRMDLYSNLMRADWSYFVRQPVGRLANSVSSEAVRAGNLYVQLVYMCAATLSVATYLALSIFVSPRIVLGTVVLMALLSALLLWIARRARKTGESETKLLRSLLSRLSEGLTMIKPLKAMARESTLQPLLEVETREVQAVQRKQANLRALTATVHEPTIVIALAIGAFFALQSNLANFEGLAFTAVIVQRIITRLGNAHSFYVSVKTLQSAYWSIKAEIGRARAAHERTASGQPPPPLVSGIQLDSIAFSHGELEIFKGASCFVPAGDITSIAGPSGVGKTTFADLLLGFYRPTSGKILIDDTPLESIDLKQWRKSVGYVPQEVLLLNASIHTNVTLGERADTNAVREALQAADALRFVDLMADGIETEVGERGAALSGGQRQRIAIARALLHRPRLLILDEPTNGLDKDAAQNLWLTLTKLRGEMTILMITHDERYASMADSILMLDGTGQIERRSVSKIPD